jgi:hypothetical protein
LSGHELGANVCFPRGIPGLATCAEMVLFSLGFWYAFSSTEYGSSAKPRDTPLPLWRAVLDAANPWDLVLGVYKIFSLSGAVSRSGDWKKYRAATRQTGVIGAVRNGVRKYKNRKGDGNGRYQEVNESMEELKKPMESHHNRTESSATQQSATEYLPMTGLGGRELYQPLHGSPPEDVSSHLMAGALDGRSRSPPEGQWNGQRYDRTPSPAGRYSVDATQGREIV